MTADTVYYSSGLFPDRPRPARKHRADRTSLFQPTPVISTDPAMTLELFPQCDHSIPIIDVIHIVMHHTYVVPFVVFNLILVQQKLQFKRMEGKLQVCMLRFPNTVFSFSFI